VCADEHVTELGELSFVADGTVAGDDDGVGGGGGEVLIMFLGTMPIRKERAFCGRL
jgi:hypothetical protein